MTEIKTIDKPYKKKRAYLKIKGMIQNPQTMEQTPLTIEGIVDTGFDGGLFVPNSFKSDLETINVKPRKTNITLADGRKVPVEICFAYVQQVDDVVLPSPGLPISFILCGNFKGNLIGMDFLKNCVSTFDGPSGNFSMNLSC